MGAYSAHRVIALAIEAGQEAVRLRDVGLVIDIKPDGSKVTNADLASDKIISDGIRKLDPAATIVSEEGKDKNLNGVYKKAWVVDSIDGTGSFIKNKSDWGVLIAYAENGVPKEGVAYYPDLNTVYYTDNNKAFKRSVPYRKTASLN